MVDPVQLRAGGLLLRPWQASDAADVARILQDPQIPRWTTIPSPYSLTDAESFLASRAARWAAGQTASWAVTDATSGAVLAGISLDDLDRDYPEVGFWTAAEARGRGVATTAVRTVGAWALERGAPKVQWLADVGNEASWRVAHTAGFSYEGRRRAECGHAHGRRTDAWAASLVPGVDAEPWPYEPFTELRQGDLTLRRWRPADAERLVELEADPDVLGWSGPLASSRREAAEAADDIAGRVTEDFLLGRAARLAVCLGDEPVGGASLRTPALTQGVGEMGWWLGPTGRGRGIGTRAVRLLAAWGFERLGLRRLSAGVHVGNAASRALAERVGFVPEGVQRQGAPAFGPGWGDAIAYAMVSADLHGPGTSAGVR